MCNPHPHHRISTLRSLLTSEASGGLVLMASAVLALAVANSALAPAYFHALTISLLGLSLLHWINDGLMAVFFLLIGLEIKRELLDGQLETWSDRILPGLAALGGMIVPALIYLAFNISTPSTLRGWAIPVATDIAFSLGVLALLGSRVPVSLKVFLTVLAILDDLGAVLIIAVFYAADVSQIMIGLAATTLIALGALNYFGVTKLVPYVALGVPLWVFVMKSGVHATIAGVLLAMVIPLNRSPGRPDDATSPLHRLENVLQPWVAFAIVPIFGFANAGVSFTGFSLSALLQPVTVGCALGLYVGKQVGVFGSIWLAVRWGLAKRPAGSSWREIYGLALLCGVGFTMSLFIGLLAFNTPEFENATKMGVLAGSILSAVSGWIVLRLSPRKRRG
jgi:NhaA family Na+:H+ antiporter